MLDEKVEKMKKIVLACFWERETNCGDLSYVATWIKMLQRHASDYSVELCDFYGRVPKTEKPLVPKCPDGKDSSNDTNTFGVVRLLKRIVRSFIPQRYLDERYKRQNKEARYRRIYRYYEEKLDGASALVIPGGGLVEYTSWRDFHYLMEMLESICKKRHIPVFFNSIGYVENELLKSWDRRWRKILCSPCVQYCSCRDSLEVFSRLYPSIQQIPCTACLSSDYLDITAEQDSRMVGLGLIRYDAYIDYGNQVDKEFLLKYYSEIIQELRRRNLKVGLFTMGIIRDQRFGEELMQYLADNNLLADDVVLCRRPVNTEEMLENISKFCGVMTVRTHSAYAAFSLNVPAMMVYFGRGGWAGKATEFMSLMGCPENAVCCDGISPVNLVDLFDAAMKKGWDQRVRSMRKKECLDNFISIVKMIGVEKKES